MKKTVLIKETKRIIYQRLLKVYPGGMSFNMLRKRIPGHVRRYIPQAINNLSNNGILSKKGNKYSISQVMK